MSFDTIGRNDLPQDVDPGSGTGFVVPNYTHADVQTLFVSRHSTASTSKQNDCVSVVQSKADGEPLPDADRQALFASLRENLQSTETCQEASGQWNVVEQALMKSTGMMRNLKKLQDMGAKLIVTKFQEGQYMEFADAAVNLDVAKQEQALKGLTDAERDCAIGTILEPLPEDEKGPARKWISSQLHRPEGERGLNWVEALLYAVHHGGRLIVYEELDAIARRDSSVYENVTWTWYFSELLKIVNSGDAPGGFRFRGLAYRFVDLAGGRGPRRGVRVAGLRVQIS